jgi:UDP-N-acetylglucosamine--N-acetylmuramyl-(pentapeptide) pyrophosphoryl-undecaprenol N-acetylglucosamine transferase
MSHLVIMAAGTGGHIMPGLAVAHEMRRRGWSVSWLGTAHGMENRLVPRAGIDMDVIEFAGLRGKGLLHAIRGAYLLLLAFWKCLQILRKRGAHAVLGMGGYVCLPGGLMAASLGKPLILMNADAALLMSNRLLRRWADRVCFGFDGIDAHKTRNGLVTGNPVRIEIAAIAQPVLRFAGRTGPLRILVIGGSLGARVLNETVPQALGLLPQAVRPLAMHQCGNTAQEQVLAAYASAGVSAEVLPFIEDMGTALSQADLVICRAGAITVSELCAAGVASVLVPLIVSTTSHQRENARWLAAKGGAIHLPQQEFSAQRVADILGSLSREKLLDMAKAARGAARQNSAALVAAEIEKLVQ